MTTATAKKMVAKFSGHCPICDRKIKAGSDSIAYSADMPVAHWDCVDTINSVPENKYGSSEEVFAARIAAYEASKARWAAACERHAAKPARGTAVSGDRTHREAGSFGGSQLAEDMGDFSGRW